MIKNFLRKIFQDYKNYLKNKKINNKFLIFFVKITYFLIFFLSFIEILFRIIFIFETNLRLKFLPFFKYLSKINFSFTPLLLYKYLPNVSLNTAVPEPDKYDKNGNVISIKYVTGSHQIDINGRPIVHSNAEEILEKENISDFNQKLITKNNKDNLKNSKKIIAMIGASTTAGTGVKTNFETYPSKLQQLSGEDFEIVNYGVGGYSTFDEMVYFWSEINKVDMVIHYTGWVTLANSSIFNGTDIKNTQFMNLFANNELHQEMQLFAKEYISLGFIGIDLGGLKRVVSESYLFRFFFPIFKIFLGDSIYLGSVREYRPQKFLTSSQASESAFRALSASYFLSKINNSKFLAVLQPSIIFKKNLHNVEKFLYANPTSSWRKMHGEENTIKLIKNYYNELKFKLEKNNIPFLDLTDVFKLNKEWIFTDECHINHKGNKEVAIKIYDYLKKIYSKNEV